MGAQGAPGRRAPSRPLPRRAAPTPAPKDPAEVEASVGRLGSGSSSPRRRLGSQLKTVAAPQAKTVSGTDGGPRSQKSREAVRARKRGASHSRSESPDASRLCSDSESTLAPSLSPSAPKGLARSLRPGERDGECAGQTEESWGTLPRRDPSGQSVCPFASVSR